MSTITRPVDRQAEQAEPDHHAGAEQQAVLHRVEEVELAEREEADAEEQDRHQPADDARDDQAARDQRLVILDRDELEEQLEVPRVIEIDRRPSRGR